MYLISVGTEPKFWKSATIRPGPAQEIQIKSHVKGVGRAIRSEMITCLGPPPTPLSAEVGGILNRVDRHWLQLVNLLKLRIVIPFFPYSLKEKDEYPQPYWISSVAGIRSTPHNSRGPMTSRK